MARVLVVDDSAVDQRLVGRLLEEHPPQTHLEVPVELAVEYAGNGREAAEAIRRQRPDLVLTDLQMPEMGGLELVREIRLHWPQLPVVLMTAHGSEDIAMEALAQGAAGYVPKRKLKGKLLEVVANLLELVRGEQEEQRLFSRCWVQSESTFLLPTDLAYVAPLIRHLQQNLKRTALCDAGDLIRVGVALREALSNALIHGNLEVSSAARDGDERAYHALVAQRLSQPPYSERSVRVLAEESPSEAVYVIQDQGPGFDCHNLPDPTDPANLEKLSGRGILLIRTFMDHVEFNDRGNEITMIKRRG